jgi:hypothetical protein
VPSTPHLDAAEALLRGRVVGGLAVRVERDALPERVGHAVAVERHVPQLARGEPQANAHHRGQRDCEQDGERRGGQEIGGRDAL